MAAATTPPIIDDAAKTRFAEAFLRTKNYATAALQVISNPGLALQMSYSLPTDPFVVQEINRLKDEIGEEGLLPSKAQIAREIYDKAKSTVDAEDYERLMKLYCSVMGHIEKPGTNINVGVQIPNVMVVKDHGTDEQWEAKVAAQQSKLVLNAAD